MPMQNITIIATIIVTTVIRFTSMRNFIITNTIITITKEALAEPQSTHK
jgi:hypothetical protein